MSIKLDPVMASYHRCREDENFVGTFYDVFMGMSDDVAKMFQHTDFERQKLMLRESLLEMLCYDRGVEGAEAEIVRIAQHHKDLGIPPEMYTMWLDALCDAVQKHDPQYTPAIGQAWREAMQKGIDLMLG